MRILVDPYGLHMHENVLHGIKTSSPAVRATSMPHLDVVIGYNISDELMYMPTYGGTIYLLWIIKLLPKNLFAA